MKPEAIFGPVSVLALWTGFILFLTGFRRIRAVRAGRVPRNAFRLGDSGEVPHDVAVSNRNLMNLLEMPVLFYAVVPLILHGAQDVNVAPATTSRQAAPRARRGAAGARAV